MLLNIDIFKQMYFGRSVEWLQSYLYTNYSLGVFPRVNASSQIDVSVGLAIVNLEKLDQVEGVVLPSP